MKGKPRIFIGVIEIAGYFSNLFVGLKKNGVDAAYLNLGSHTYKYTNYQNYNPAFFNWLIELASFANKRHKSILGKFCLVVVYLIKPVTFLYALLRFNVFIFAGGSTFFRYYDYRILRLFGKKIIFVSLGSDSRPQFMNGNFKDDNFQNGADIKKIAFLNKFIFERVILVERLADVCINYPQHAHFHQKDFISGMHLGFPTIIEDVPLIHNYEKSGKVRILHAPTRPKAKGSDFFRSVLRELSDEGLSFDFVEITGKTNQEVVKEIIDSDVILDELYSDMALGGLGAEAAALGKPVIVSGYYASYIEKDTEFNELPPSLFCLPENVKNNLRNLITNKELRIKIGEQLNAFVKREWRDTTVADRYLKIILNQYPDNWITPIDNLSYLYGWGLSKDELVHILKEMVINYGEESLCLQHNSQLKGKFLDLLK